MRTDTQNEPTGAERLAIKQRRSNSQCKTPTTRKDRTQITGETVSFGKEKGYCFPVKEEQEENTGMSEDIIFGLVAVRQREK